MAEITFSYPISPKSIGGFEVDAFIRELYTFSSTVTDIPVEEGSVIADHVIEEPPEIQISGFIGKAEFVVWEGALPTSQSGIDIPDPKSRIRAAYFELSRLKSTRQPIDLVTGLDVYPGMIITEFNIDRTAETGADLPFEMTLKQIKIVRSETTTVNGAAPSGDQTAGSGNMGVAGTSEASQQENHMKERWRVAVRAGRVTLAEYERQWGVPYPQ